MVGIWQIVMLVNIVLLIISIVLLIKLNTSTVNKIFWLLLIVFIPLIGSICFLIMRNRPMKD